MAVGVAFDANDSNFRRFVQKLLDGGHIPNETASDIAAHVVDDKGPLSVQQTLVFVRDVVRPFSAECLECAEPFPWSEAYDLIGSNPIRCAECEARSRKFMI